MSSESTRHNRWVDHYPALLRHYAKLRFTLAKVSQFDPLRLLGWLWTSQTTVLSLNIVPHNSLASINRTAAVVANYLKCSCAWDTSGLEIDGVTVRRPDGQLTYACESFYRMHVRNWKGSRKPTTNAGRHVMTIAEIVYSHLCPQLGLRQDLLPTTKIWPTTARAQLPKNA